MNGLELLLLAACSGGSGASWNLKTAKNATRQLNVIDELIINGKAKNEVTDDPFYSCNLLVLLIHRYDC